MDPRKQVMDLLQTYKCKLIRTSGTGHKIYRLPGGQQFTLTSEHAQGGGDRRSHNNSLADLRRMLGIRPAPKPAPDRSSYKAKRLRAKPPSWKRRISASTELDIPEPRNPVLPAPPPGPPPEKIMAPRITLAESAADPAPEPAMFSRINYAQISGPAGPSAARHEPSDRSGECRSLPKEVIEEANRQLRENGSTSILRMPSDDILAIVNGEPLDSVRHRAPANILDLQTQHDKIRANVDSSAFIANALMYLVEFAHEMRGQLRRLAERPAAPAPVQSTAPRIEMEPIATNGNGKKKGKQRAANTPKALAYRAFIREYCSINCCGFGEAAKYWNMMSDEEKAGYYPKAAPLEALQEKLEDGPAAEPEGVPIASAI